MPSWVATLCALILALLKAAPVTIAAIEDRAKREREAEAERRRQEKDARVDASIASARAQAHHEESDTPKS
jgi:hypothetical protein